MDHTTSPGPLFVRPGYDRVHGYPLVPWVAVMALGFALGTGVHIGRLNDVARSSSRGARLHRRSHRPSRREHLRRPAALVVADDDPVHVLSFINANKTPPSLFYLLMTVGPALLAFAGLTANAAILATGRNNRAGSDVLFLAHVWYSSHRDWSRRSSGMECASIATQSPTLGQVSMTQPPDGRQSLPVVYVSWVLWCLLLYPACRWYAQVKATQRRRG